MTIRLIVSDMDGTLLNSNNQISEANKEILQFCQKQGIQIILSSGRGFKRLYPYAKELQLEKYNGLFIESNGVTLTDIKTKKRQIFHQMNKSEALNLCHLYEPFKTEIQIYFDNGVYYYIPESIMPYKIRERKNRQLSSDYPWMGGPWSWVNDTREGYPDQKRIFNFDKINKENINKINLSHDETFIDSILDKILKLLPEEYHVVRTCPRMLEIAPSTVSKGNALSLYMNENQISPDQVIVFGDGENDISMFKNVKYSVAMGNASDIVKKHATFVTKSNEENGVAFFLNKFFNRR
ncbi:Cof-type HAD-IIB family hydrolase [Faecalicoccus pleomorphus]|uniref:Cof-type HAD-IIB family hydrolase n=1 Tax=Faecalicoccus pleomorphus TaxID=1323 RepID=UPI001899B620|nr:Cof-type HAD-IIB family hydrolase [Faecalicoccus pleomorphus]MDB7984017.1 Cof-type HAD-IIB family hydrolase [Faecalicoccus pleomorphus]